jgi:serine/threonine-protein kinase
VHRDFTPDNLILDKDGTLKLIDFDVAQQREQTTSATVVGKHAYLPPEQFRGKPCPQSDIYALGATLHFLLTGCDPEPLTSSHPLTVRPEIAAALDGIVARCTQLDLDKRYETAAQIKLDLHNMQSADQTINVKETASVCE